MKTRVFALLPLLIVIGACANQSDGRQNEAYRLVKEEGALLLDVRTPQEYSQGHIKGAKNFPIQNLPAQLDEIEALQRGDKSRPIVVYCTVGVRAARAKQILGMGGFSKVINLGGLSDWPAESRGPS